MTNNVSNKEKLERTIREICSICSEFIPPLLEEIITRFNAFLKLGQLASRDQILMDVNGNIEKISQHAERLNSLIVDAAHYLDLVKKQKE